MFIDYYPFVVELFIILYSSFLLIFVSLRSLRLKLIHYEKPILLLTAINFALILHMLQATSWPVTGDGYYMGALNLLRSGDYKNFFERYLEFQAFYLSCFVIQLYGSWYFIKRFFPKRKKWTKVVGLTLSYIILVPILYYPIAIEVDFESLRWNEALIDFVTVSKRSGPSPLIIALNTLSLFLYPPILSWIILVIKILKGKL